MQSEQKQQRIILTDDGELRDLAEEMPSAAVLCIHCGKANRSDGHFCRSCGQSLDDQTVVGPDGYLPP